LTIAKGAIVADSYLGKVKTIICFSVAYMLGLLVLFITSLPVAIENGYAFGGLMTAMVLIGMSVTYYLLSAIIVNICIEALAVSSQMCPRSLQSSTLEPNRAFGSSTPVSA
jgi:dipeptide/tripeptide permease